MRFVPMRRFLVSGSMALVLLAPLAGRGQINPFASSTYTGLSNEDFKHLIRASNGLLARNTLDVGSSEGWKNPQSGASGNVVLDSTTQREGMLCHLLMYESTTGEGLSSSGVKLLWCKAPQGWRIVS